jgi:hypothetical protein
VTMDSLDIIIGEGQGALHFQLTRQNTEWYGVVIRPDQRSNILYIPHDLDPYSYARGFHAMWITTI